ncbi:hypothetical protein P167DRAFT_535992 [Morchella conica CCBAS932]|uniref:Uncharacterized protein n=1 Tax=Morchella conica CCBAS932 TaxID=1392247 RepID=A0A3N4KNV9_9PEZI|nr:hypothetical protein P167DRAFT_535992 [Morchella conica CCBAS932]
MTMPTTNSNTTLIQCNSPTPSFCAFVFPSSGMSRHLLLLHLIFYVSSVPSVHPLYHICISATDSSTGKEKENPMLIR